MHTAMLIIISDGCDIRSERIGLAYIDVAKNSAGNSFSNILLLTLYLFLIKIYQKLQNYERGLLLITSS